MKRVSGRQIQWVSKYSTFPEFQNLLHTMNCYFNLIQSQEVYLEYINDVVDPYLLVCAKVSWKIHIQRNPQHIMPFGTSNVSPELFRNTSVPYKLIRAISPDQNGELTELWKQNEKESEEFTDSHQPFHTENNPSIIWTHHIDRTEWS